MTRFLGMLIRIAVLIGLMILGWRIGENLDGAYSAAAVVGFLTPLFLVLAYTSIRGVRLR